MRIVLAPDSFKGSVTALEACQAMAEGILEVDPSAEIVMAPMADGGEGTVENLVSAYEGRIVEVEVTGPAGKPVKAKYGIIKDNLCIVEVAETSGLVLLSDEEKNPLVTTTYGFGELISDALCKGCKTFVIGLGGSGTNDGGCGMAEALGYEFLDAKGESIDRGGGSLDKLANIRTDNVNKKVFDATFMIACDVKNPLCGPEGASYVFGPQKGATEEDVEVLDNNLKHLAEVIKNDMGMDVCEMPGAGAAGGLGAGTVTFLRGKLQDGFKIISELLELKEKIVDADLVFTGEGQCDFQTLDGKAPFGVVSLAKEAGLPSVIIAGSVGKGVDQFYDMGVREIINIKKDDMTLDYAKMHAKKLIRKAAHEAYQRLRF